MLFPQKYAVSNAVDFCLKDAASYVALAGLNIAHHLICYLPLTPPPQPPEKNYAQVGTCVLPAAPVNIVVLEGTARP